GGGRRAERWVAWGAGDERTWSGGRCCPHCIVARRPERDGVGTPARAQSPRGWRATNPAVERMSFCQREPVTRWPEVSKRIPATSMNTWARLDQRVHNVPAPASPHDMRGPEASGASRSPAAASAKDTEPEQSYTVSSNMAWTTPPQRGR